MKKIISLVILLFSFGSLFAENLIELDDSQKKLIQLPKKIESNYNLASFKGAYHSFNIGQGFYHIFEENSLKKQKADTDLPAYLSRIIYVTNDNKDYKDILYISEKDYFFPQTKFRHSHGRKYLKFDDNGRVYINVTRYSTGQRGILLYSPSDDTTLFFSLPSEYNLVEDFEITPDGKYILVNGAKGAESKYHQTFLFNTSKYSNQPEALLYMNASYLSSIVYSQKNKAFYIVAGFFDYTAAPDEMGKLCVLREENNVFSKSTMQYYSQNKVINGNLIDYWSNCIVLNELDDKIYTVPCTSYDTQHNNKLCELIDNKSSIKIETVKMTENLNFNNNSAEYHYNILESTPVGLYLHDKNNQSYIFKDEILEPLCEEDIITRIRRQNEDSLLQINLSSPLLKRKTNDSKIDYVILARILAIILLIALITSSILLIYTFYLRLNLNKNIKIGIQKKVLEIQENERAKLSRDIHDSVVQDIRAIRLQTDLIDAGISQKSQLQKERVIEDITQVIVKLRNICYNLTPAELTTHKEGDSSEIELISILDSLSQQFYVKTKIPCTLQIAENLIYPKFNKDTSLQLVRTFQEILNNIEKHSYATKVNVLIRNKNEENQNYLVIFIIDDGIGCDIDQILKNRRKNHFGLNNMRERINLIGGNLEFFSSQNEGMKIKITVKI